MLPSDMLNKARLMMNGKHYADAKECVGFVLLHFPRLSKARLMRAEIDFEIGSRDLIDDDIAQCLSTNPGCAEAMLLKAKRLGESDDSPESVAGLIARAIALEPYNTRAVEMMHDHGLMPTIDAGTLGFSYLRSGWTELATKSFRQHLNEGNLYLEIRQAYAESLWLESEYEESIKQCRLVLDHLPSALKPTLLIAHILAETGRVSEGEELLQRTFEVDPEYLQAIETFRRSEVTRLQVPVAAMLPAGGDLLLKKMQSSTQKTVVVTVDDHKDALSDDGIHNQSQEAPIAIEDIPDDTLLFEPVVEPRVDDGEGLNLPDGDDVDVGLDRIMHSPNELVSGDIESGIDLDNTSIEEGHTLEEHHELATGEVRKEAGQSMGNNEVLADEHLIEFMAAVNHDQLDEARRILSKQGTDDIQLVDSVFGELLATDRGVSPEMWQLFGDHYMRRSQPDLAYQAYGKVIND
tara:strand:- start:95 stop:1486 length:1392 start_codon:yes stop_codon:yes gene_type:complete